jgi:hypothetical protein
MLLRSGHIYPTMVESILAVDAEDITVHVLYNIGPGTNTELGLDEIYDVTNMALLDSA